MDIDEIVRKQKEEKARQAELEKIRRLEAAEDRNRNVLEVQKAYEQERLERASKEREQKAADRQTEREARNALVLEKRMKFEAELKSKRSRERAIWQAPDSSLDHKCTLLKSEVWEKREKLLKERIDRGDGHLLQRKSQLRAERSARLASSPRKAGVKKERKEDSDSDKENKPAPAKLVAGRVEISKAAERPPRIRITKEMKENRAKKEEQKQHEDQETSLLIQPSPKIPLKNDSIVPESPSNGSELIEASLPSTSDLTIPSPQLGKRGDGSSSGSARPSVLSIFAGATPSPTSSPPVAPEIINHEQTSPAKNGQLVSCIQTDGKSEDKKKKQVIFSAEVPENSGPRSIERRGRNLTEFPSDILTFSSLRRLSLYSNLISEIPQELAQLELLEFLDLSNNDLRSLDPTDQAANLEVFHSLKSLRELKLSGNEIHWMPPISTLTSLDLSNNGLLEVPFGIGSLPLKYLDLTDNQIREIPGNLFEDLAPTLDIVLLDRNDLYELPIEIGSLKVMTALSLEGNKISQLPFTFGNCIKLERLNLNFNGLSSLPDSVFGDDSLGQTEEPTVGLFKLTELRLNSNQFEEIPEDLFLLSNLKIVDFTSNSISIIPSDFELLFELTELLLSNNNIGSVPESLISLGCLETLNLSNNQITHLPGAPANLVVLDLENNLLQSLPSQLSQLEYLSEIYVSGNPLRELPSLIFSLTSLTKLYAAEIGAEAISEEIESLVDLEELDLSQNNISTIPEALSNLTSLQWLSLHHNKLSNVPESLSALTDLQTIDISGNAFFNLPPVCLDMHNRGVEVIFIDEYAQEEEFAS